MIPFRIKFTPLVGIENDATQARLKLNEGRKLAQRWGKDTLLYPVAVAGGGPSIVDRLDELREWPGEIWAINDTCEWLLDRGIEATLFTVDPVHRKTRAKKALLASWCHPDLFDSTDSLMFSLSEHDPEGVPGGTTSAGRAPAMAVRLGYLGVHFFGCDSSFEGSDHVDRDEGRKEQLIVRANGRDYRTYPDLLMQAECLSDLIRLSPDVFVNKSGGLLEAMVKDDGWEVVAVSESLKKHLIDVNGDEGLFDNPYQPPCKSCGQAGSHYDDCEVGMGA